nr:MAG TPA: hypothetical protein [Crassvirales sp.]
MALFSRIKHYLITKKQQKSVVQYMSQMTKDTIDSIYKLMNDDNMSFDSIKGYIRHLPIVGIEEGYPENIYIDVTKCLLRMWEYSLVNGYTKAKSLTSFLENDLKFKNVEGWNNVSLKLKNLVDSIQKTDAK